MMNNQEIRGYEEFKRRFADWPAFVSATVCGVEIKGEMELGLTFDIGIPYEGEKSLVMEVWFNEVREASVSIAGPEIERFTCDEQRATWIDSHTGFPSHVNYSSVSFLILGPNEARPRWHGKLRRARRSSKRRGAPTCSSARR